MKKLLILALIIALPLQASKHKNKGKKYEITKAMLQERQRAKMKKDAEDHRLLDAILAERGIVIPTPPAQIKPKKSLHTQSELDKFCAVPECKILTPLVVIFALQLIYVSGNYYDTNSIRELPMTTPITETHGIDIRNKLSGCVGCVEQWKDPKDANKWCTYKPNHDYSRITGPSVIEECFTYRGNYFKDAFKKNKKSAEVNNEL